MSERTVSLDQRTREWIAGAMEYASRGKREIGTHVFSEGNAPDDELRTRLQAIYEALRAGRAVTIRGVS
jgi:alkylhydroperoxidase/carboxymuconolactone decarboxylase family protein YurZ